MESARRKYSSPFDEVFDLHRQVGRLMGNMLSVRRPIVFVTEVWRPNVDVYETDDEIVVLMDIAGVDERQISAELEGDVLTIHGERRDVAPGVRVIHQREVEFGSFSRTIRLPALVDRDSVRASLKNGFLEIRLDKAARRHSIAIE